MGVFSSFTAGDKARPQGGGFIVKGVTTIGGKVSAGVNKVAYGMGRVGMKGPIIATGILAALGGFAWWANSTRNEAARETQETLREQALADVQMPLPTGGNTLMGLEPTPGAHANRIRQSQGQSLGVGVDASQPAMTVAGAPVSQLGA